MKRCKKCGAKRGELEFVGGTGKIIYVWCLECRTNLTPTPNKNKVIKKRRTGIEHPNATCGFYRETGIRARENINAYLRYQREICSTNYSKYLLSNGVSSVRKLITLSMCEAHRENLFLKREVRKLNQTIKEIQK